MNRVCMTLMLLPLLAALALAQETRPAGRRGGGNRPDKAVAAPLPADVAACQSLSMVLGRPTDTSVTVSVLSAEDREGYVEYGPTSGQYTRKTEVVKLPAGSPVEILLDKLDRDKPHFYRLQHRTSGEAAYTADTECCFHTQRAPGNTFTFEIQGDSHPERPQMFDPALYAQMLRAAATDRPDFYLTIGDDFSVDTLRTVDAEAVRRLYLSQRCFLSLTGRSAPLFLVNGNHEQAARCNLDGTANNVAVWAQTARNRFFPQPAPDGFYSGDAGQVEHIGLLRDYHAWTWGDALFVVIDPYWHSAMPVDNVFGGGPKSRELWGSTLGDVQYQWLKKTLTESRARFKFVFTHHVLGTGRGGIEQAGLFEWGGQSKTGVNEFAEKRPGWELPIHQLMVRHGVTIFFQGHDHVFVRQQLDGVVYQTLPLPAGPDDALHNKDAYRSGEVWPGSGRVRVTVSAEKVRVEYVRSRLPKDTTADHPDGEVVFSYEIPAAALRGQTAPASDATVAPAGSGTPAPVAKVTELAKGFQFTEGPVPGSQGSIYFTDVQASRIHQWTADGKVSTFRENSGRANGLKFDRSGNLLICEGGNGRVVAIDPKGTVTVVADTYQGKRFNQPNDLWIDPKGGVYFSDPIYGRAEKTQGGEHVYYVTPDRQKVVRVIDDMVRPNGLVGTPDGKTLYVADHGAGKTYRYVVNDDGTLRDKTLFVERGSDGMTLDRAGNVYLTDDAVYVHDPKGQPIARIAVPQRPTNLCFYGKNGTTLFITAGSAVYSVETAAPAGPGSGGSKSQGQGGPRGAFRTDVPQHPLDIILGRPTAESVTLSVLCYDDRNAQVVYGTDKESLNTRTAISSFKAGEPREVVLGGLMADTQYYYQLRDAATQRPVVDSDAVGTFHTQCSPGASFTFTVQADSHLDENTSTELYRRTLENLAADAPDFHIDLGDTFMVDKHADRNIAARQYLAQRYYLGVVGRSVPLFLVLGNHDGEDGRSQRGGADSLAVWSNTMRKRYYPTPLPDAFYTGNQTKDAFCGLLQNHYAWTWGEALFVVLDPYWYSPGRPSDDGWGPTLGVEQYNWLRKTLAESTAKYKFVFIHNLVSGWDRQGRGGTEAAGFNEWGGRNLDGSDGFKEHRPGWEMPVHQLLVRHGVTMVFHGHDHFYARQELDGIVYQLVPQPGFAGPDRIAGGAPYGYKQGILLGGAGHLRVAVTPEYVRVEYVRAGLATPEAASRMNRTVAHSYTLPSPSTARLSPLPSGK